MRKGHFVCASVAFCLALVCSGPLLAGEACPDGASDAAVVTVSLNYADKVITVNPSSVEIYETADGGNPTEVCWIIENHRSDHVSVAILRGGLKTKLRYSQLGDHNCNVVGTVRDISIWANIRGNYWL